jgi:general nucleoside transport system permease protein
VAETKVGPAETTPSSPVHAAPRRGVTGLTRLQLTGIVYVLAAVGLGWGAGRLDPETVQLRFGLGDFVPFLEFGPVVAVRAMAAFMGVAGVLGIAERRTGSRLASIALLVATVLVVPVVLVASLALSRSSTMNVVPLFVESLRLATPIALGALAGLFCERAGVVNIGIEGMMLAGAGIGFVVYGVVGAAAGGWPLYLGVLVAVLTGGMMAALHALMTVTFRIDQIVSGVAINLLAIGVTSFLRRQVIVPEGLGGGVTLGTITIPGLSELPVIGQLFVGKPIYFAMFLLFVLTQVTLFRSAWGLRVRSVGEQPHAGETVGINVIRTRYQSIIIGGLIAGLGGAWFSLETVGTFDDVMTNGKGFIALAALIFGKWRPWPAFGGAVLFGFTEALGRRIQLMGVEVGGFPIPAQFLQMLPYVVTIVVLAGAIGRAVPPASVGKPYERAR